MTAGPRGRRLAALLLGAGLLLGLAFACPALAADTLRIGSKRFTESYVLAQVLAQVAAPHAPAKVLQGLGNTAIVHEALRSGAIDLYPEYVGTIEREILRGEPAAAVPAEPLSLDELNRRLAPLGLGAAVPFGFSNGYALAMREADAARLGMRTLSEMSRRPGLRLGLSNEFVGRADGWPGLSRRYGFVNVPRALDHGLAYDAIARQQVDAIDVYTTDSRIGRLGLRVLKDDLGHFPRYDAVVLYRLDVPQRFPAAWAALQRLAGSIDERTMIALNARAELEGAAFDVVARDFLAGLAAHGTGGGAGPGGKGAAGTAGTVGVSGSRGGGLGTAAGAAGAVGAGGRTGDAGTTGGATSAAGAAGDAGGTAGATGGAARAGDAGTATGATGKAAPAGDAGATAVATGGTAPTGDAGAAAPPQPRTAAVAPAGDGAARPPAAPRGFLAKLLGADLWRLTLEHVGLVVASVGAAALAGIPLAVWVAPHARARAIVLGATGLLQTVPSLALLAALISLLGRIGTVPALLALALYALLPVMRNTVAGLAGVPPGLKLAALGLGMTPRQRLFAVELPLALPTLVAGLRTATAIAIGTATIAAFIGAGGYGERIVTGLALNDRELLLAGALPAALLALAAEGLFEIVEARLRARRGGGAATAAA